MSAVEMTGDVEPSPKSKVDRRHPLVVTSERLADHAHTYDSDITPREQAALITLAGLVDRIYLRVSEGGDQS